MKLSHNFADFTLKWNTDEKRSRESLVTQYAVSINFISIAMLTVLAGLITGKLAETLIAGQAFMALRMVSGGFHLKSLDLCAVITATIYAIIPFISISPVAISWINAAALVIVILLAPTNLRNTFWTSSKRAKAVFKTVAIVITASGFVFDSGIVTLGFATQALLLIPRREVDN
ncbi:accessory gene regulator B family protein [Paenibacillus sp. HWE-109]|uniref:accessory gene regulator B family protein n=1 Tax=Paenibacillus sp. HWE-109 TaxID=1306526 RepID=UPI001EE03CA1|nr:accessory gene regulator B family protein [Paenibacillus sp. HWE-109]UKS31124.1 accessory gene regulator B family protein [Paenibacillus sp. HWE-109]